MKFGVFGGSQGVGKEFVKQALNQGHSVTVLTRTPTKLSDVSNAGGGTLKVVEGDVNDPTKVDEIVTGQDAIFNSLGNNGIRDKKVDVCSKGSDLIIAAMKNHNVKRTVIVTSFGVNESWNEVSYFKRPFFQLFLGRALADKCIQENSYFKSDLDWTIVRPGRLLDRPLTGKYKHGERMVATQINRADVADFCLKQFESSEYLKKCAVITE